MLCTSLSSAVCWRALLLKRTEIFLAILAPQETGEFRLQCRHCVLFPVSERAVGRGQGRPHGERSGGGDLFGNGDRGIQLLTGRRELLYESHAVRLVRAPLLPRQHVAHR